MYGADAKLIRTCRRMNTAFSRVSRHFSIEQVSTSLKTKILQDLKFVSAIQERTEDLERLDAPLDFRLIAKLTKSGKKQ